MLSRAPSLKEQAQEAEPLETTRHAKAVGEEGDARHEGDVDCHFFFMARTHALRRAARVEWERLWQKAWRIREASDLADERRFRRMARERDREREVLTKRQAEKEEEQEPGRQPASTETQEGGQDGYEGV